MHGVGVTRHYRMHERAKRYANHNGHNEHAHCPRTFHAPSIADLATLFKRHSVICFFIMKTPLLISLIVIVVMGLVLGAVVVLRPDEELAPTIQYVNTDRDEIVPTLPLIGQRVTSPLVVEGRARGSWYFEASAPMMLVDWDGRILAEGYVQAQGDWMTEEFVPFQGIITFSVPDGFADRGALVLRADNPSGLPEYDRSVQIPVRF